VERDIVAVVNEYAALVLGELKGQNLSAVEQAHREANFEPTFVTTVEQAVALLDGKPWRALLVDITAPGASRFCQEARGRRALYNVPLIGLSPKLTDLAFLNALRWGADDLVALGAAEALRARLSATPNRLAPLASATRGDAVVADADQGRCDLLGRVLSNAGYNVKYALDAVTARFFALKTSPELIVLNADVLEARRLIEDSRAVGKRARWVVMTRQKSVDQLRSDLSRLTSVTVMSSHGPPENVLFSANLLNTTNESKQRNDERALYGTMVLFRSVGDERDECGFSYSISSAGLYIRTLLPPPANEVWLEVIPAGQNRRVRLAAKVAWSRTFGQPGAETAPPGFGLRIVDGLGEDLGLWEAGFRSLAPESPESVPGAPALSPSFRVPSPAGRLGLSYAPSVAPVQIDGVPSGLPPSVPSRPSFRTSTPSSPSITVPRPQMRSTSIAPMPVLASQPPAWSAREPLTKPVERMTRAPNPTSNDDRGRTVLGMGIPADIRGAQPPVSDNPGMQPTDLAKLLADAGLLDTPSPDSVSPRESLPPETESERAPVSLNPGDLESLPPRPGTGKAADDAEAAPQDPTLDIGPDENLNETTEQTSVAEVLERLFDPGAGANPSNAQAQGTPAASEALARTVPDAPAVTAAVPETIPPGRLSTPRPTANSSVSPKPAALPAETASARKRVWAAAAAGLAVVALAAAAPLFIRNSPQKDKAVRARTETHSVAANPPVLPREVAAAPSTVEPSTVEPSGTEPGATEPGSTGLLNAAVMESGATPIAEVPTFQAAEPSAALNSSTPISATAPLDATTSAVMPVVQPVRDAPPNVPDDANTLPENMAYIYIASPLKQALVFVHGVPYGATNQWLRTKCGLRFVRLGTAPGRWLSPGVPSRVRCRAGNVIEIAGDNPAPR
jgi:DNA-binding response OmpR family regulator